VPDLIDHRRGQVGSGVLSQPGSADQQLGQLNGASLAGKLVDRVPIGQLGVERNGSGVSQRLAGDAEMPRSWLRRAWFRCSEVTQS
jgi:hypothetical protein